MANDAAPVVGLTVLGGAVRFAWLGDQRFWLDEAVTVGLLRMDFSHMLEAIPLSESTPPLYYVVAWVWATAFGTGEFGLRSLSALIGTAAVPLAYATARRFGSRRAAVFAAALVALSPGLVWYSQEARAYSLLVTLSAATLLFFAQALSRPRPAVLAAWSAASIAALATHYFAAFLIIGEAAVLAWRAGSRRAVALACVPVALAAGALATLALEQRSQGHLDFIGQIPLGVRLLDTPEVFVSGQTGLKIPLAPAAAALLVAAGLVLLARTADPAARSRAMPLVGVATIAALVPLLLAFAGLDYVLPRNLLPLWIPIAILAAAGLAAPQAGRAGTAVILALVAFSIAICAAVPAVPELRREAITAGSSGAGGNRASVTYRLIALRAGDRSARSVRCPVQERAHIGRARWLGERDDRPPLHAGAVPGGTGWRATVARPVRRKGIYELYVVCVPRR